MKTITLKKFAAFIILVFSVSIANAQCFCDCFNQQRNNAICVTNPNGHTHCKHVGPRFCGRVADPSLVTDVTSLDDIYPNPVSTFTTVYFFAGQTENVSIKIFDVSGRLVSILANTSFEEGDHEIIWNADEVNSGIYLLMMETASYSENWKLLVNK